ncbi:MAG: hypothetical protein AB3N17_02100 [Tateyamaria sp.]
MTDHSVSVEFVVLAMDGTVIPVNEAAEFFGKHSDQLDDFGAQMGRITFQASGTEPLFLGGNLLWLLPTYCVTVVEHVLVHGSYDVVPPDLDYAIRFRRDAATVTVDSEHMDPHVYPAKPVLAALLDTMDEYCEICVVLWPDIATDYVEEFSHDVERMRTALADAGLD